MTRSGYNDDDDDEPQATGKTRLRAPVKAASSSSLLAWHSHRSIRLLDKLNLSAQLFAQTRSASSFESFF